MMTTLLILLAALLMAGAIVFCFIPRGWSAMLAFAGMGLLKMSGVAALAPSQMWFWGIAAVLVFAISILLPQAVVRSRAGVAYICVATIAGLLLGLVAGERFMVLGGVVGALLGSVAFATTPGGRGMGFPSLKFMNYLCAKALPALITLAIVAVAVVVALVGLTDASAVYML